ncbi:ATP-binding protein [Shimia ponticola]|uniref:ATP-binding protein n=1 Tax=Shimia ponticola TaxID=2582893 RepID=UPI00164C625D|nr:ATP-binding protein [Shimia ponticola]
MEEAGFAAVQQAMLSEYRLLSVRVSVPETDGLVTKLSHDVANLGTAASDLAERAYQQQRELHQVLVGAGGDKVLAVAKPLYIARRPVAAIELGFSMSTLRQNAVERFLLDMAAISALLCGLALFLYLTVRHLVVRPLNSLKAGVDRFAAHRQLTIKSNKSNDEIGALFDSFEKMSRSILDAEEKQNQRNRLEAVGQLAGGIAHDFNNLLQIILGNADLLEGLLEDDNQKGMLKDIADVTERGRQLTARLLAYSQKQPLFPVLLDLSAEGEQITKMLRRTLGGRIELEWDSNGSYWAYVDRSQLENALINLAINARDAMPDGGKLTVRLRSVELSSDDLIESFEAKVGRYVAIELTDTGTGIPQNALSRIYEPFFTTKGVGKGSGLGLSMVFGFIRQSNGQMSIESQLEEGTKVSLFLPMAQAPDRQDQNVSDAEVPKQTPRRILLVDAGHALRTVLKIRLEAQGHTVLIASDGMIGLELLENDPDIDLIVSDVMLPGALDGPEVCKRAIAHRADLRCLLISEHILEGFEGMKPSVQILMKPFKLSDFDSVLDQMMET